MAGQGKFPGLPMGWLSEKPDVVERSQRASGSSEGEPSAVGDLAVGELSSGLQ